MKFWSRNNLEELDRLTAQDVYYIVVLVLLDPRLKMDMLMAVGRRNFWNIQYKITVISWIYLSLNYFYLRNVEYQISETSIITVTFWLLIFLKQSYFPKLCPIFVSSLHSYGKRYGNKFKHKVWSAAKVVHSQTEIKILNWLLWLIFPQKINGWKIYHLTSQMEDVIDMENELTSRLSSLQKKLDKNALNEVSKDVTKVQELIKANLQRSKVIQVNKIISILNKTKV